MYEKLLAWYIAGTISENTLTFWVRMGEITAEQQATIKAAKKIV